MVSVCCDGGDDDESRRTPPRLTVAHDILSFAESGSCERHSSEPGDSVLRSPVASAPCLLFAVSSRGDELDFDDDLPDTTTVLHADPVSTTPWPEEVETQLGAGFSVAALFTGAVSTAEITLDGGARPNGPGGTGPVKEDTSTIPSAGVAWRRR